MANTTKHITLRLSGELVEMIDKEADKEKRSRSNLIELMLWNAAMDFDAEPRARPLTAVDSGVARTTLPPLEAIKLELEAAKDRQIAARGSYEMQCLIHEEQQSSNCPDCGALKGLHQKGCKANRRSQ